MEVHNPLFQDDPTPKGKWEREGRATNQKSASLSSPPPQKTMQKRQPGVGNSSTPASETQGKNISQVSKEAKLFIEATKLIPLSYDFHWDIFTAEASALAG